MRTLKGHRSMVYSVAISADGKRVVSGSVDTTVKIWDVETGVEVKGGCLGEGVRLAGGGGRLEFRGGLGFSSLIFPVAFVLDRRFTPIPRKVDKLNFEPLTSREVFSPSPPLSLSLPWVGLCWWGGGSLFHTWVGPRVSLSGRIRAGE